MLLVARAIGGKTLHSAGLVLEVWKRGEGRGREGRGGEGKGGEGREGGFSLRVQGLGLQRCRGCCKGPLRVVQGLP